MSTLLAARPIRLRLTLWYVLLLAVILVAFSAGLYVALRRTLHSNLDDALDARAATLLNSVTFAGDAPRLPVLSAPGVEAPDTGDQYVRLYDRAGALAAETGATAGAAPGAPADIRRALNGTALQRTTRGDDDTFRAHIVPLYRDGAVAGALEVGQSESDISDTLRALLLIFAVALPLTLVIASFGGLFLARRALAPIDHVTRLAQRVTAEDLSQRLGLRLPDDEVGRLARTFDDMIARLDDAFRRQRQFTADASHELRTPLTAMKGQVEVALARERSAGDYRDVLREVNAETDRLIRLVASLLTLARADAGQIPITLEAVDMAELAAGVIEHVLPLAEQRGVSIGATGDPTFPVLADEDLLLQLLLNLLDNAVKYTPPGGQVGVEWGQRAGLACLAVRDTGVGIEREHLPRVFDRFYRADKARSRAAGGTGLGLAICRWIAEAHGGRLTVESVPGQGSVFELCFPVRPPADH